jgi:lipid II:glycine glycyltransferase (peptidoglycan interpeptide bridge formation enzyme)
MAGFINLYQFIIQKKPLTDSLDSGSRFLQTPFWAKFKSLHDWQSEYFLVNVTKADVVFSFTMSVLIRTFCKAGLSFSLAYIPMAPEISLLQPADRDTYGQFLSDLASGLKRFLPANTFCIRFDPPIDFYTCEARNSAAASLFRFTGVSGFHLVKSKTDIQPPDTVLLDLSHSTDEILDNMKPKWRYNIKLAEKKGVHITSFHGDEKRFDLAINSFYTLYETTARRDGIAIHAKSYYKDLLEMSSRMRAMGTDVPLVTLYMAEHEADQVAAIITLFCKREAVYLYGASANIKRNLMPAYLLQWTALQDAKKYGCPVYDFYGIPPSNDEHHPMHGLYLFKTGFGGTVVHRFGSVDVAVSSTYKLYRTGERLRAFWHKRVKKLIAGR